MHQRLLEEILLLVQPSCSVLRHLQGLAEIDVVDKCIRIQALSPIEEIFAIFFLRLLGLVLRHGPHGLRARLVGLPQLVLLLDLHAMHRITVPSSLLRNSLFSLFLILDLLFRFSSLCCHRGLQLAKPRDVLFHSLVLRLLRALDLGTLLRGAQADLLVDHPSTEGADWVRPRPVLGGAVAKHHPLEVAQATRRIHRGHGIVATGPLRKKDLFRHG
mmetsp:Transcript_35072/g.76780  ORF Transcript_35072/g.76780 Transcript_35072/m.76780 type:complete len:216 (-) Transcript_35072:51-698(-)